MKVISPEEEKAHYNSVLKGGAIGGGLGIGIGLLGVVASARRFPAVGALTLPFRAFLVTSVGTFGAIVNAERHSNAFHLANNPMNFYKDQASRDAEVVRSQETSWQRFMQWGQRNRYSIVLSAWAVSMGVSGVLVSRNRFLSTSQKLVQVRMYAQGLTLAVLVASAVFETSDARQGKGRWETIMVVDPDDPEHKHLIEKKIHKEEYQGQDLWRDMVAAEERRLSERKKETRKEGAAAKTE
ncbi:hypothetical protein F4808DRAFT_200110 [Astrocystis sublimbata]|nr:hypothetical protein F4808DRAFT_200110 [Astrocystis sublimbata]